MLGARESDIKALNEWQIAIPFFGARTAITDEGRIVTAYAVRPDSAAMSDVAARMARVPPAPQRLDGTPGTDDGDARTAHAIQADRAKLDTLSATTIEPAGAARGAGPGSQFDVAITENENVLDHEIWRNGRGLRRAVLKASSDAAGS